MATLHHTSRGKGAPGIPDVLSRKWGTSDMHRGGVPGESGDKDSNAGALSALACPRHRGDSGGRKISPPKVRPVRHASNPEGAERAAPGTAQCLKGAERKRRRLAEAETQENLERVFEAYGAPIESVTEFKYLGRILTATDDD